MPNINIIPISAPLPEGWEGTPDEFREQIFSTLTFEASGAFLTGQIGGATPTSDVGLFVSGRQIYMWDADSSSYKSALTVPIGVAVPYLGSVAPEFYLMLDGVTEYAKEDYPELYAIVGDTYKKPGDSADNFRLPDWRGRMPLGVGIGDYDPLGTGTPGRMKEITLGEYGGKEWVDRKFDRHLNQPAAVSGNPATPTILNATLNGTGTQYSRVVNPYIGVNWIVRAL